MSTVSEIDAERGESAETATSAGTPRRASTGVRSWVVRVIRAYQVMRAGRPSPCRFVPSCSEYASEAVERHGVVRGGLLALRRILRCQPWGGHGLDPVPDRKAWR